MGNGLREDSGDKKGKGTKKKKGLKISMRLSSALMREGILDGVTLH
jgi:hypothetical protein